MVSKRKKEIEGSNESGMIPPVLIEEVRRLIADSRQTVATTINANLTLLYWRIGNRIIVESSEENWRSMASRLSHRCHDNWFMSMVRVLVRRICVA